MEENKEIQNSMPKAEENSNLNFLIIVVIIGFVANMGLTYWLSIQQRQGVDELSTKVSDISTAEIKRAGGMDNYRLLDKIYGSKVYQDQQTQSLKTALAQFGVTGDNSAAASGANQPTQQPSDANAEKAGKLTKEEIAAIMKDSYVKGSKDAKITILEFSDLQCPYCKRFETQGSVDSVIKKYEGKVNNVFKHYPLPFHEDAITGAIILECVGEVTKGEKFYEFIAKSAEKEDAKQDTLLGIAKDLKVDEKKLNSCLGKNSYKDKVTADQKLGQEKFAVSGTPASIIINNETGEWQLVSGAVPASNLEEVIDKMLK